MEKVRGMYWILLLSFVHVVDVGSNYLWSLIYSQLTHNLTVVFFSRTYIRVPGIEKEDLFNPNSSFRTTPSAVRKDHDGRMFEVKFFLSFDYI